MQLGPTVPLWPSSSDGGWACDAASNVRSHVHHVNGHDLCRVQVDPAGFPVDAKVTVHKPGAPMQARTEFYVRVANGTKALAAEDRTKYVTGRWGGAA